jgi:hypothetical protein
MLKYRRVLAFFFLVAFAEEEARLFRWALTLVIDVGAGPALQGLGFSAIALAANAGLVLGVLWLLRHWWRTRRSAPDPIEPSPAGWDLAAATDPTVPRGPVGQGGPEPASRPEEGGSDEQRSECA